MTDITLAPRRRPLWGLFIAPVLLLIAAIVWSAFWFYAASQVDVRAAAWQAQEAKSGRIYDCGNHSVSGFPFRLEVRCSDAGVKLVSQNADQLASKAPITAKLGQILVVAQVYDPAHLIAEFTAPAIISDRDGNSFAVNWRSGESSVIGLPGVPQRVSVVFDDPALDRVGGSVQVPLASAKHVELHGRLAEGSAADQPVIESVLQIRGGVIKGLHPLLEEPFDADVRALVHGLKDFSPKPWPVRFRELQASGGHVEIVQSRIQQGDLIAVAAGNLGLSPSGHIEGDYRKIAFFAPHERDDAVDRRLHSFWRRHLLGIGAAPNKTRPSLGLGRFRQLQGRNAMVVPCDAAAPEGGFEKGKAGRS